MKRKRRWLIETLEQRIVLDGVGPNSPPQHPAWESVIVAFNDNVANPSVVAKGLVNAHGGQLGHVYNHALKGFSAQLPEAALQALAKNPQIKQIEADLVMQAFSQITPTGVDRIDADISGLANIDNVDDRVNVNIAIIDSGIDADHPDLNVVGGRHFYTVTSGRPSNRGSFEDGNYDDNNGHGSHVAGTAAALDNDFGVVGVAPGANLWAVKVLDANASGYVSDIIKGIDWVTSTRTDGDLTNDIHVANMSLGGQGVNNSYRTAIKNSVARGVVYVVAAGNEYRDILGADLQFGTYDDTIPAAYPEVATISAIADTDGMPGGYGPSTQYADFFGNYEDDEFADFSNFSNDQGAPGYSSWYNTNNLVNNPGGLGIDLMLPGVDIYSTYKNGGYAFSSGTSMAAPHATGLAALYIAANGPATDANGVYAIRQALIDGGKAWTSPEGLVLPNPPTPNPDSPDNHYENLGWAGDGVPNQLPIADAGITQSGNEGNPITFDASGSSDPDGDSLTYVWDFGDGQTAHTTDPTISHSYEYGGTFAVSLTVNDGRGGQSIDTTTSDVSEVNDVPVAVAGGPYRGFANSPIAFDASASSDFDNLDGTTANDQILWYTWDFNDGTVLTTTDVSVDHTYTTANNFNVSLSVNDGATDSLLAVTSVAVDAEQSGVPMYVSSIDFESKRGGKDWRAVIEIRSAEGNVLAGVSVTIVFANQTYQGTTDSNGLFRTGWIRDLSRGTHYADVSQLVLANYVWNPLALDSEVDDGGLAGFPDGVLVV
ncbi:S8 family serine peptidase [Novipirellula sp. SH528]|uniref:S8 family serine peptidase n=1 Tax=Novipirellula sp. SH528 TaxID=3454466 RepID=UPI003FA018D8